MSGYAGLGRITDPATQAVAKQLFDLINALTTRVAALEADALQSGAAISANGERLTNVADPQATQDAVTLAYLRAYVASQVASVTAAGATGEIDTTAAQTVTVTRGIITEIV